MRLSIIALRNIWRNKRRTILTMSAITLATLIIVFMFSLLEGMKYDMKNTVVKFTTGHIRIRNIEYDRKELLNPLRYNINDYERVIEVLKGIEDVDMFSPRIQFGGRFGMIIGENRVYEKELDARGVGVDFKTEDQFQDLEKYIKPEGRLPQEGKNEILITIGLARDLKVKTVDGEERSAEVGDSFDLFIAQTMAGAGFNSRSVRIAGIVEFPVATVNRNLFLMPINDAGSLLRMNKSDSKPAIEILIILKDPDDIAAPAALITKALNAADITSVLYDPDNPPEKDYQGLIVASWHDASPWYAWLQMADIAYNFIGLLFIILGTTVIMNTTMMTVYERMKEIGTIAAMGMTGKQIILLFFLEAFFMSFIAALLGVSIGSGLVAAIGRIDMSQAWEGLDMDITSIITFRLNIRSVLFTFLYSIGVASFVTFIPSRKAAKIEPVEALRSV
jgi:putative ABC transport system permease protein